MGAGAPAVCLVLCFVRCRADGTGRLKGCAELLKWPAIEHPRGERGVSGAAGQGSAGAHAGT
jgi:hypothetical protein